MGDDGRDKNKFVNRWRLKLIKSKLPCTTNPNVNELLGVLIGDGWLGISGRPRRRKQVCFCGNLRTEIEYRKYLQKLITNTLRVNGYYKEREKYNTYYKIINSETIFDFFRVKFDFPVGTKSFFNVKKFPKNWKLQRYLIRGIFDTDGSTLFDKDPRYKVPYPILDVTMKNKEVLDWAAVVLSTRGFKIIRSGRQLKLKGADNFHKWFKDIAPANSLHKLKYSRWCSEYNKGL